MHLHLITTILATCLLLAHKASAQPLYPVKKDKKWGLINKDGRIVLQTQYDAIGEFDTLGYAILQMQGKSGLIDSNGKVLVSPQFQTLRVLKHNLFAVMEDYNWKLLDRNGQELLPFSFYEIDTLAKDFYQFRVGDKWGITNHTGQVISTPQYDEITAALSNGRYYFFTRNDGLNGLVADDGTVILPPVAEELKIPHQRLVIYRENGNQQWKAVDHRGEALPFGTFDSYKEIEPMFFSLLKNDTATLINLKSHKVLLSGVYESFSRFDTEHLLYSLKSKAGLVNKDGSLVLSPRYNEIQPYQPNLYRANLDGNWGIVMKGDSVVLPFDLSYIGPLLNGTSMVMRGNKHGLSDAAGKLLTEPVYDRLEIAGSKVKCWEGNSFTLLDFGADDEIEQSKKFRRHFTIKVAGQPTNTLAIANDNRGDNSQSISMDKFEWFLDNRNRKWGLRRLSDGSIKIPPVFRDVEVLKDLGLTLVALEKPSEIFIGKLRFKVNSVYGLVKNDTGIVVHKPNLIYLDLDRLKLGKPTVRCIYENGSHGLIDKFGRDVLRDLVFLGRFKDGMARASKSGYLTAVGAEDSKSLDRLEYLKVYLDDMIKPIYVSEATRQITSTKESGYVVCTDCKWGYIDTTGNWVVPPIYSEVSDFSVNLGFVRQGEKWGIVDNKGNEVVPCKFDDTGLMPRAGGIAIRFFSKSEKYGLIDSMGMMVLEAVYDQIESFREGCIAVKRGRAWGFADELGREIIPCCYQRVESFSEGLAAVQLGSKWGFIDKEGKTVLACSFSKVGNFSEGLAFAKDKSQLLGYIDRSGQWVIKPQFYKAKDFDRGAARVEMKSGSSMRTGLINTRGQIIAKPRFLSISDFDKHGLAVAKLDGKTTRYQLINLNGELMGSDSWQSIHPFQEGLARVQDDGLTGYIDTAGQLVIPTVFSKVGDFHEGLAVAWKDNRCGYIDPSGKFAIEPVFSRCSDFKDSLALVEKEWRRTGLIDHQGREIVQPGELKIQAFSEGRALVKDLNNRHYFINKNKSILSGYYANATAFRQGVAAVKTRDAWTLVNQRGILLSTPKFSKIYGFEDGYAKVKVNGFAGLVNAKGEPIVEPAYDFIGAAGGGVFRVERGNKIGYVDLSGKWIWELQD